MAKFTEMNRRIASRELVAPVGPCRVCNDPSGPNTGVTFEYHDEDYGREYSWVEPAAYCVCRDCHIYRLHQRAAHPASWQVFLAHFRRGGYARETREPEIKAELGKFRKNRARGELLGLKRLRSYSPIAGEEWFANLSMEPQQEHEWRPVP